MQNDLNISLSEAPNKQTIMVIGLQQAGKTAFVQKFSAINKKLFQDSKIPEYDIELIDTPSYDSFFTLLPFRDPKVTGYIIVFCQQNSEILKSTKQIRKKLFSINGQHKRTVILFNEFTYFDNRSSEIQEEILDIKYWSKQQDIIFSQLDIKRASSKEIVNFFERMFMKKIRTTLNQKIFIIIQFGVSIYVFLFAIWLSIKDPSLIISNIQLEIYCLALLCLGISNMFIPYFIRTGIKDSNTQCINRSKIFSCLVTVISVITLIIASMFLQLLSCLIMSILFTFNSVLCLFFTFLFMKSYFQQDQIMIIYTKMLNQIQYEQTTRFLRFIQYRFFDYSFFQIHQLSKFYDDLFKQLIYYSHSLKLFILMQQVNKLFNLSISAHTFVKVDYVLRNGNLFK
ncbi:unnamed protein product (macronuclear) [Paramecium tetraurelia]|uniref:G domain-containing protein n=1 Tax=Paramecium tetraurelia TaxID=5888 RepID=A0BUC5_PARTE|nr:uncharacterized protein GSPATT00032374001 [Paramecium tetraurelia]CAK62142.1 unnamed protein product [Paramecium tetraurelia]|eukprot:XP_001429540.1 hypothetical protein (macronuclear) [Paramecium tetraurelia strain d4-2]